MTNTVLVSCALFLVAVAGACAYYLIRALQSLTLLFRACEEFVRGIKPEIVSILEDTGDATSSFRELVLRVNKVINSMVSFPEVAKTLTKTLFSALFREKRGSSS